MNEFIKRYIELKKLKALERKIKSQVRQAQIKLGASAHKLGYLTKGEKN